uniref:G domain-containing protein n=1 Tax=Spumella elongata TaxID=89044 RepID=A0A7S3MC00_9STRA
MSNTTLIVGKAGVGKSTLINKLAGATVTKESAAMHSDGTAKATSILHEGQRFIDTVGLESKNHDVSKSELFKLLRIPRYEHVTIVLVTDDSRMTTWTDKFLKLLDYLDINETHFKVIVYLITADESFDAKMKEFELGINSRRYIFTFKKSVAEVRACLTDTSLRNKLKLPAPATVRPATVRPGPAAVVRPPSQAKAAKADSWFTKSLYYWNSLVVANPVGSLSNAAAERILKFLCQADEIKEVNSTKFQELAFIGDRHLSDVLARIEYSNNGADIVDRVPQMVKDQHLAEVFQEVLSKTSQNAESRALAVATKDYNAGSKGNFLEAALFLMLNGATKGDRKSYLNLITRIRSL